MNEVEAHETLSAGLIQIHDLYYKVTRFYGIRYHEDALARGNELFNVFGLKEYEGKEAYDYLERLFNGYHAFPVNVEACLKLLEVDSPELLPCQDYPSGDWHCQKDAIYKLHHDILHREHEENNLKDRN
ncbi:hypothetical protein Tco_0242500 [Tanacetum coccineum]